MYLIKDNDIECLPLAHQSQQKCHMQIAWIRMRRQVTMRLDTRIQAV